MNKTKRGAFLIILFASLAFVGYLNINMIMKEQIPFFDSATVHSIKIDSISLLSSDPAYGIYAIIGYGYLDFGEKYIQVDMTEGVNINSFSRGEAYAFEGQIFEIFVNSKFKQARLKIEEISEINYRNKKNILMYSICILPLITLIGFYIIRLKIG